MTTSAIQARVAFLRKLATTRDATQVIELQTEYAQAAFAASLKRSKEFYELLAELTRDTVQSITITAEQTKAPVNGRPVEKKLQAAE
jgi:phasin family protein